MGRGLPERATPGDLSISFSALVRGFVDDARPLRIVLCDTSSDRRTATVAQLILRALYAGANPSSARCDGSGARSLAERLGRHAARRLARTGLFNGGADERHLSLLARLETEQDFDLVAAVASLHPLLLIAEEADRLPPGELELLLDSLEQVAQRAQIGIVICGTPAIGARVRKHVGDIYERVIVYGEAPGP